ncbi:MAG TPA: ribonuclease P protein component [Candidatus Paceibacterota bacterium]
MLSRQHRVAHRHFPTILRASRGWHSPALSLRVATRVLNGGSKSTLFALVVSRGVASHASDRNKLKRRARAIINNLLPQIKDNYACLLFFKKEALSLSYPQLKQLIREIFSRASIIAN